MTFPWSATGVAERLVGGVGDRLVRALGQLARRGGLAAPVEPRQRRLVLLQVDGLSGRRLARLVAEGSMPHLARRLAAGSLHLARVRCGTATSTPVFQPELLYGATAGVPGFGWYDRALGRRVRMDLAEDVAAIEPELGTAGARPLLDGGASYGTIWGGGAESPSFNVVRWGLDGEVVHVPRTWRHDAWDLGASLVAAGAIAGRLAARLVREFAASGLDLARFFVEHKTTRFEWRFFYMRPFVTVILRDVATLHAVLDVLRGVPVIYLDYFDYDEIAHRRGPDHPAALEQMRGVDAAIERIAAAVERVPDYGYELYILSDHGQSGTTPFERLEGRELESWVVERAVRDATGGTLAPAVAREIAAARTWRFWARTQGRWTQTVVEPWVRRREERAERLLAPDVRAIVDGVQVVTGGSIAHLYLSRDGAPLDVRAIERRWPRLLADLCACRSVGFVVARGPDGPVFWHRGRRWQLPDDADALAALPAFRAVGPSLLCAHLEAAVASARAGDLVLFGAFAASGNVGFDFELGSHGGVHPDELDAFFVHPAGVPVAFDCDGDRGVRAGALHRFFHARHDA